LDGRHDPHDCYAVRGHQQGCDVVCVVMMICAEASIGGSMMIADVAGPRRVVAVAPW
jgi:hypothetical protein